MLWAEVDDLLGDEARPALSALGALTRPKLLVGLSTLARLLEAKLVGSKLELSLVVKLGALGPKPSKFLAKLVSSMDLFCGVVGDLTALGPETRAGSSR